MIRKSQATIEMTVSFLMLLSLFFGIIGIWAWGDRQIANRQPKFNNTRLEAGIPKRQPGKGKGNKPFVWTNDPNNHYAENIVCPREKLESKKVHHKLIN